MVSRQPGRIGRKDQRRDLTWGLHRGLDGSSGIGRHGARRGRGVNPMRDRPSEAENVRGQGCVEMLMPGGMVAHHVHHGRGGAFRVVEIRRGIRQARAEMQQGRGRTASHATIPVGHARDDPFEEAEHPAHVTLLAESGDEMHLGGSRIGETHLDATGRQGREQGVGPIGLGGRTHGLRMSQSGRGLVRHLEGCTCPCSNTSRETPTSRSWTPYRQQ